MRDVTVLAGLILSSGLAATGQSHHLRMETRQLPTVSADVFAKAARDSYRIEGDASWDGNTLILTPGAKIERGTRRGSSLRLEGAFSLPRQLAPDTPMECRIWFRFDDDFVSYVRLRQARHKEEASWSVALVDTGEDEDGDPYEDEIRVVELPGRPEEQLQIDYHRGLFQVMSNGTPLMLAHVENGAAGLLAVGIEAIAAPVQVRQLKLAAATRDVSQHSPEQQRQLAVAADLTKKMLELRRRGRYREGADAAEKALRTFESVLGPDDPETAQALANLATLYEALRDLPSARTAATRGRDIRRRVLGRLHPDHAASVNQLANLNQRVGEYGRAEEYYKEALAIRQAVLGEDDPKYAVSLNGLAELYRATAEYAQAEPLYAQVVETFRKAVGEDDPAYATVLDNFAKLYQAMGDTDRAEPLLLKALAVRESAFGTRHPAYGISLHNLGLLYLGRDDLPKAREHLQKAVDIWKAVFGDGHPSLATSLNALATAVQKSGDFDSAESMFKQALEIRGRTLGQQSPAYGTTLNNLALLYNYSGKFEQAEQLFEQAVEISRNTLGESHPTFAQNVKNLAGLYLGMQDYARAEPLYAQALRIIRGVLDRDAVVQSSRQQTRNQTSKRRFLDDRLTNALENNRPGPSVLEDLWRWKGTVTARQRAYRLVAADPQLAPSFNRLQELSQRLSVLAGNPPTPPRTADPGRRAAFEDGRAAWEKAFSDLNAQREALEQQIAADSVEFRRVSEPLTVEKLREALPRATAFVDFLQYDHAQPDPNGKGPWQRESRFVAFVVTREREPVAVPVGAAGPLIEAINRFRSQFSDSSGARDETLTQAGAELRRTLWLPIEKHLQDIETVIVSPDTSLGMLPFGALPGSDQDRYLFEQFRFASLPMAAMLLELGESETEKAAKGLLVVGDVDYGTVDAGDLTPAVADPVGKAGVFRGGADTKWASLPGFRAELDAVTTLYRQRFGKTGPIETLVRDEATTDQFLADAGRHSVLHVITHGYFADPTVKSESQTGALGVDSQRQSLADPFINTWQPGLLSGLVLARAGGAGGESPLRGDGILRASQIEAAALNGVDLVVLSACETGLGAVAGGEGLTGLQRAFHVAGARSVIASLWKVDDRATQELMRQFYTNLWVKKQSKIDALRNAQLWMLNNPDKLAAIGVKEPRTRGDVRPRKPAVAGQRAAGRTSPFFWAAFTLSGDWR